MSRLLVLEDGITKALEGMISRANLSRGYLDRVVYKQYQNAQRKRWETENTSETGQWASYIPDKDGVLKYPTYKLKKFASSPGGGSKMMIASGKLFAAAVGPGEGHLKEVGERSLVVGIDTGSVPYAEYPAEKRPIMEFSPATITEWLEGMRDYVMKGILG